MALAYATAALAALAGLAASLYCYFLWAHSYWRRRGVYCLRPSIPFGHIGANILGRQCISLLFADLYDRCQAPFAGFYIFNKPVLLVKDPEVVRHILVKDFNCFCDRGMYVDEKKEPLSGHLFRLSGNRWRHMRSKLSPSFSIGKLRMMFGSVASIGRQLEKSFDDVPPGGMDINVSERSLCYSSDVIASVIFGIEVNSLRDKANSWWYMVKTLVGNLTYARHLLFTMVAFMPWIIEMLGLKSLFNKSTDAVFELVKDVVDYRERHQVTRNDFMQLLIQLKNKGEVDKEDTVSKDVYDKSETSDGLSIYEVSAQAYSMFYAGFETAATTISYCLYELAGRPELQARVHEEIDRCVRKHGAVNYECANDMTYLECVVNETLRKYPVLPFVKRVAVEDYRMPFSETVIEKGTHVYISTFAMHRDASYFSDPLAFDPDRFLPENKGNIHPYTYMPFGEGPRNCIGKKLGLLQTVVGVVMVLKNHSLSFCDETVRGFEVHPYNLTCTSRKPIILRVTKRD